ncbi:MAG: ribosome hibernation-promoting factor, HPF/YfiA family [Candidatus Puniceispirillaceae bacterium]
MKINVSGKNMDTGMAFQGHAEEALSHVVDKYFHNAISASVTLEKADEGFTVRTRVNLTRRMELESTGQARDAHAALDAAIEHAEKRLRRHKRRLKNHRNSGQEDDLSDILNAPLSLLPSFDNEVEDDVDYDNDNEEAALPVIAELSYEVESLAVDQAVMRLELSNQPCLLFRNAAHDGLNMVYRREDKTIGWVDPRGARRTSSLQ